MDGSFLTFLGVSIVVIVAPGPDTVLTVRNTFRGGRASGVATALGVSTG
jgi:threonine/homoserine/homoserine lactone efflux protein